MQSKFTVDTFRQFLKKNNFEETLNQSSLFYEIIEQLAFQVVPYANLDVCVASVLNVNQKSIVLLGSIPDNIDIKQTKVYNNIYEITNFYFDETLNLFYINLDRHFPIDTKIITQSRLKLSEPLIFNYNVYVSS